MDSSQLSSTECSPIFLMRILEAINSLNRQGNARQIAEFIKKNYQYPEDILLEVQTTLKKAVKQGIIRHCKFANRKNSTYTLMSPIVQFMNSIFSQEPSDKQGLKRRGAIKKITNAGRKKKVNAYSEDCSKCFYINYQKQRFIRNKQRHDKKDYCPFKKIIMTLHSGKNFKINKSFPYNHRNPQKLSPKWKMEKFKCKR